MRRTLIWALLAAGAAFALVAAAGRNTSNTDSELADAIASELRCPVCQGLSIADSDSASARDLRADIARRIASGEARADIVEAYVDRYGEWILLRPRRTGLAALVWVVPPLVTAAAAMLLVVTLTRWRTRPRRRPTDSDRALVEDALAGFDGATSTRPSTDST